ncbi:ATP-dependent Clp protease proteolytic subunit [Leptodesmis sp.]|uniref:ATP-dependent Clp protease proteolytic subunit n=1 Tax=Leptodesmis sp. TaxID=3100501 RepID=UPI0040534B37
MLYLDRKSPGKDIYLYINSSGGDITAGLAIYDTIRSLQSDVVTVGLGEASSMASILLASGTKGKRVASPHTRIMIHQPWSGVTERASDIAIEAKEILYLRSLLNRLLSEMTGQPLKRIEVDTDRDFYMFA